MLQCVRLFVYNTEAVHQARKWNGKVLKGGMLKKAASGVLALLPCSRTESTLRASKGLRPCWTNFFEHSLPLLLSVLSWACIGLWSEIFNSPIYWI